MPILIAFMDWFVTGQRRWGRYGLVLMVSMALHLLIWQFRGVLEHRALPTPNPEKLIEVILVPPPKPREPVAQSPEPAPAPKPPEPKKAEVKPQPKPVAQPTPVVPPRPKNPPKPRPVALPKPDPKSAPPPVENVEQADDSPPVKPVQDPPEPVSRSTEPPVLSSVAKSRPAEAVKEGGGKEEGNSPAHYLQRPSPEYPALAKRRNWEGRVVIRVKILADGSCGQAEIHQTSGHDVLDEAALEAVCKVRYAPNKRNGQPVEGWVNVPINFNLDG